MSVKRVKSSSRPVYISSVSRDRITTSIREGQVLRGTVLEKLSDEIFIINFRGFNLASHAPFDFKRGMNIYVRVVEVGEQILMRLLPEEEYQQALGEANTDELDSSLKRIGIVPDDFSRTLAHSMLFYGLPLTRDRIEWILSEASRLDIRNEGEAKAIAFLESKRYPLTTKNVGLALYLGCPAGSKLFSKILSMEEITSAEGEGIPLRIFENGNEYGICFHYQGDMTGTLAVISAGCEKDVEVEFITSQTVCRSIIMGAKESLLSVLEQRGLTLDKYEIIDSFEKTEYINPIGLDLKA